MTTHCPACKIPMNGDVCCTLSDCPLADNYYPTASPCDRCGEVVCICNLHPSEGRTLIGEPASPSGRPFVGVNVNGEIVSRGVVPEPAAPSCERCNGRGLEMPGCECGLVRPPPSEPTEYELNAAMVDFISQQDKPERREDGELPECPHYVAHPQSVWFEEHWRPKFELIWGQHKFCVERYDAMKAERDKWRTAGIADVVRLDRERFEDARKTALAHTTELTYRGKEIERLTAENERLERERKEAVKRFHKYRKERDEAQAEVERLKALIQAQADGAHLLESFTQSAKLIAERDHYRTQLERIAKDPAEYGPQLQGEDALRAIARDALEKGKA